MRLNSIKPTEGSKKNRMRVGRGIGCTKGKTFGRGHKGQHSRTGLTHKVGFEGGQTPLYRRIPKFGFTSRKSLTRAEIRLSELNEIEGNDIDMLSLLQADLIDNSIRTVKIILSGTVNRAVTVRGIAVTKGAAAAIIALGGSVEAAA